MFRFFVVVAMIIGSISAAPAEEKSIEQKCKESAVKNHVPADKLDAYIKSCIEKHERRAKKNLANKK